MWGIAKKSKKRDPEKEFRLAVGVLMRAECELHTNCDICRFKDAKLECVTVMRECGV